MIHRITLILNHMQDGGAARVASYLSNAWVERGRQVTLLTNDDGQGPLQYQLDDRVVHRPLNFRSQSRTVLEAARKNLSRITKLRQAIVDSRPDVLVSFLDGNNVLCLLATRGLKNVPIVISERTDPHGRDIGFFWENLRRITYPWADCLVTQTRHAMDYFPARVRARGRVIPNPVLLPQTDSRQSPPEDPAGRLQLVTVGRLSAVKGHDLLIEAFARIVDDVPDWDLTIYGEGLEREALTQQVDRLGLQHRVRMPGQIRGVAQALQAADLFVLPSRAEGFPNALAEAMACGLPVVSFDCPSGPAELIQHQVNGILVRPGEVADLASALAGLMMNPTMRARLAAKAPEVLERYSLSRVIGLWETVLAGTSGTNRRDPVDVG